MSCKNAHLLFVSLLAVAAMPSYALAQLLDAPASTLPQPIQAAPAAEPLPLNIAPEATPTLPAPAVITEDTFKQALMNAYTNNPALKAERAALGATDEGVAQAISGFRPTIEAGYAKGRERSKSTTGSGWDYDNSTGKTLDISQPIFSGGESWANFKSARDRVKAGRALLKDTEQQVLYNAVVAYSDVAEKKSVLRLNQNNVDVLRKQLEATQTRFDVGELTRTDVAQSEARLSQAVADERQALGDVEAAHATFKRAIGYAAPEIQTMPAAPVSLLPTTMDEAIAWGQFLNPLLEAVKFRESAASSDIDARVGALLPEITLNGAIDRSDSSRLSGISRSADSDALTLNVSIPLYQSGAEWSRVREARSLADQAKYTTLDVQNAVVEDVTRAWQDYNTAKAVIVSTEEAMRAAEVALDGVRQENQYGVRTILDVLDAEQELFTTRVNLVKAERSEKVHAYRLLAAVGKLTAQDLGLSVEKYDPKEHYDNVKYQLLGF